MISDLHISLVNIMEHVNKIHEESNVIQISEEVLQYLERGEKSTIWNSLEAIFASKTSAVGSCFPYRLLRRNTHLESPAESHWSNFSLVTWSSGKG